jgi:hypothetical protein
MVTVTTRHDHIRVGRQSPANAGLSRAQGVTATVSPATPRDNFAHRYSPI